MFFIGLVFGAAIVGVCWKFYDIEDKWPDG